MDRSGGFLPLSPASSDISLSSTRSVLPQPRSRPIRAGSAKEDTTRRFLDERLLNVQRKFAKKFHDDGGEVDGYTSMKQVCRDLAEVVDVLWLSGTPALQNPYLLRLADLVQSYMGKFPPAPRSTFRLLAKLDYAFASLLKGVDIDTGTALPGFGVSRRAGMSKTDMVRCRSLVEATRIEIVQVLSEEPDLEEVDDSEASSSVGEEASMNDASSQDVTLTGAQPQGNDDDISMDVARVYERTIVVLGEVLGGMEAGSMALVDSRGISALQGS